MVSIIALNTSPELFDGKKVHYLSENGFAFVHTILLSDIIVLIDLKGV
jgi:hypothetical protein